MTAVAFDNAIVALASDTVGDIAGEAPGIVTLDNVPGVAVIDLLRRSDNAWLRRTISAVDGTYRFTGLALGIQYSLIGRDLTDTWDDVIAGRILPFQPIRFLGDAPSCTIGTPYHYSYTVLGGESPYEFTLIGDLPDGLILVATDTTLEISGTASALAADQTFEIEVEDARGSTASVTDSMAVVVPTRYWRLKITAGNGNNNTTIWTMKMRGAYGGADLATGGSAFANSEYSAGYLAALAFDGNGATRWAAQGTDPFPHIIGYYFPAPVYLNQIELVSDTGSGDAPSAFTVESSHDGVTWSTEWAVAGQTGWANQQTRIFNRP